MVPGARLELAQLESRGILKNLYNLIKSITYV